MDSATATGRRASRLPLAVVALAMLMTATGTLVAVWWDPIDARFIGAADDAGWDQSLLLPHQELIWLGINGAVLLSVVLVVVTFIALRRSRRS